MTDQYLCAICDEKFDEIADFSTHLESHVSTVSDSYSSKKNSSSESTFYDDDEANEKPKISDTHLENHKEIKCDGCELMIVNHQFFQHLSVCAHYKKYLFAKATLENAIFEDFYEEALRENRARKKEESGPEGNFEVVKDQEKDHHKSSQCVRVSPLLTNHYNDGTEEINEKINKCDNKILI